jgi:hypothetical protein
MKTMKTISIFIAVFLIAAISFGQARYLTPLRVTSTSQAFGRFVPNGTVIYLLGISYYTTSDAGAAQTLAGMLTAATAKLTTASITDSTFIHSTGIDKSYANMTWYGTNTFSSTLTGTLTGSASLNWLKTDTTYANKKMETFYHAGLTFAPKASPTFTGTVTHPYATGDSTLSKYIKFTAITDTTFKRICLIVIGTQLYYGNGTFYYKVTYAK